MAIATLIRAPSVVARYALTLNQTPPLSVAYLAGSLTAAGHTAQVIDAVGEALQATHPSFRPDIVINGLSVPEIVQRIRPDTQFVGISCLFSHEWPVIRELIAAIAVRFPGVPIVCGGEHATAVPELCLEDAPALARLRRRRRGGDRRRVGRSLHRRAQPRRCRGHRLSRRRRPAADARRARASATSIASRCRAGT